MLVVLPQEHAVGAEMLINTSWSQLQRMECCGCRGGVGSVLWRDPGGWQSQLLSAVVCPSCGKGSIWGMVAGPAQRDSTFRINITCPLISLLDGAGAGGVVTASQGLPVTASPFPQPYPCYCNSMPQFPP